MALRQRASTLRSEQDVIVERVERPRAVTVQSRSVLMMSPLSCCWIRIGQYHHDYGYSTIFFCLYFLCPL
jgi:hypothetical protein